MFVTSCRRLSELAAVLAVALAFSSRTARADPAPGVTFTKIADTGTLIPAGQWAGEKFARFGIPAMRDGRVAFVGSVTPAADQTGVYTWSGGGTLAMLADPSITPPGGGVPFTTFRHPSVTADGYALDTGSPFARTNGVYHTVNGALASIGALPITHTAGTSFDDQDTWFYGYSFHTPPIGGIINAGIYRVRDGEFENLVPIGTPTPSAPGYSFAPYTGESRVIARNGRAVFWAWSESANGLPISGLYEYANGSLRRVADSTMIAQGSALPYRLLDRSAFAFDGERVLFRDISGTYIAREGRIEDVAAAGQAAPGGGAFAFTDNSDVSVSGGHIVFSEGPNPIGLPHRIYSDISGTLARIVGRDDLIFGETIARLQIDPDSLSGNRIVFYAEFTNGNTGIFVATVPEPAVVPLVAALAIPGMRCVAHRRKSTRHIHARKE